MVLSICVLSILFSFASTKGPKEKQKSIVLDKSITPSCEINIEQMEQVTLTTGGGECSQNTERRETTPDCVKAICQGFLELPSTKFISENAPFGGVSKKKAVWCQVLVAAGLTLTGITIAYCASEGNSTALDLHRNQNGTVNYNGTLLGNCQAQNTSDVLCVGFVDDLLGSVDFPVELNISEERQKQFKLCDDGDEEFKCDKKTKDEKCGECNAGECEAFFGGALCACPITHTGPQCDTAITCTARPPKPTNAGGDFPPEVVAGADNDDSFICAKNYSGKVTLSCQGHNGTISVENTCAPTTCSTWPLVLPENAKGIYPHSVVAGADDNSSFQCANNSNGKVTLSCSEANGTIKVDNTCA